MGVASTYLSVVAAGALTAGVAASNIVVAPDVTEAAPAVADVGLSAITIPLLDIDQTVGPLTVIRQILLSLGSEQPNELFATWFSKSGTIYDLPGLHTNFQDTSALSGEVIRHPGESIGASVGRSVQGLSEWSLLGLASNVAQSDGASSVGVTGLTGGAEGIGAALAGALSNSHRERKLTVLGAGLESVFDSTLANANGQLSFMPFDGFKAVGGGTLLDTAGKAGFKLGSLEVGGGGHGRLSGDAGLCLGSAQATNSCGGQLAFASVDVPVGLDVPNIFSVDISTNLAVAVGDGHLSVQGDLGGTVKVGSVELGRVIPINFQIPSASSTMLANNNRQSSTVRESFLAAPRKLGSDNGSSSTGRHAARDVVNSAVAGVKTAVDNAVHSKPRHTKPDTAG